MSRIILTYGLISGAIIILGMISTIVLSAQHSPWPGYLDHVGWGCPAILLLAIKSHRDKAC
ncbi:hypothetical protein ACRAWD_25210 [Caulobacter segnis]